MLESSAWSCAPSHPSSAPPCLACLAVGAAIPRRAVVLVGRPYAAVWRFAAAGALAVRLLREARPAPAPAGGRPPLLHPAARTPGAVLALSNIGPGAFAGFVVLHLAVLGDDRGGLVFVAFAATVVGGRLAHRPRARRHGHPAARRHPARCARAAVPA